MIALLAPVAGRVPRSCPDESAICATERREDARVGEQQDVKIGLKLDDRSIFPLPVRLGLFCAHEVRGLLSQKVTGHRAGIPLQTSSSPFVDMGGMPPAAFRREDVSS